MWDPATRYLLKKRYQANNLNELLDLMHHEF
jgi:hypothetical protein